MPSTRSAQRPSDSDLSLLAGAMHQVTGSITAAYGADCLMSSLLAAEVLRQLGHDARAVAGSAAWRVGKSDGDVITHAMELCGQSAGHFVPAGTNVPSGLFHAWVEIGDDLVDFTTVTLREKARILDQMDGGTTTVDWAPDVLWVHRASCRSFREVANGFDVGAYVYVRHEEIERVVFPRMQPFHVESPAAVVLTALDRLKAGELVRVIGVGGDRPQTLDSAIEDGRARGFVKINLQGSL